MELKDKIVFLTGGSSGIGYECAKAYVKEGSCVAVASNNEEDLETLIAEIGNHVHIIIHCDISKDDEVKSAIEKTIKHYGRIDAIHNNAGIVTPSVMLHETTDDEWDKLMDTNLKSIYLTTKYGLDTLKKNKGTILNTSSLVAEIGQSMHAAYSATKGAINALTKSMALDYAKYHIRVNAVCPAWVRTPAVQQWILDQPDQDSVQEYISNIHPLGYCPDGDVIADACVFLLSDKARFITGCTLPISGGAELGYRR